MTRREGFTHTKPRRSHRWHREEPALRKTRTVDCLPDAKDLERRSCPGEAVRRCGPRAGRTPAPLSRSYREGHGEREAHQPSASIRSGRTEACRA